MLPSAAHRCGAVTGLGLAVLLLMSLTMITSALPTPMPQPIDVANSNGHLLAARHMRGGPDIDSAEQVKTPLTDNVKDTFKIVMAADHPDVHGPKKKGNHCPGYPNRNCPPPPPAEVATRILVDDTQARLQHSVARKTFEYTGDASIESAMLQVRDEPASPQYRGQMKKATALDVQRAVMQQLGESAVHLEGRGEANIANMEAAE